MLRGLVLDRSNLSFREIEPHKLGQACDEPTLVLWVDVADPTEAELKRLQREFGFHPLAIEDCRNRHQRPKVDEYPGYYFIVLYECVLEEGRIELHELSIFLGKNYVVTVHHGPILALSTAERLWHASTDLAERGAGLLAYLVIDTMVDAYFPLLDEVSERMEEVEESIFQGTGELAVQHIFRMKKELLILRRVVAPLRDVFNTLLRREQPVFSRETSIYFQDVYDHLIRIADSIDNLRDMLSSAMDAYLSVSNQRTNLVMKRLTATATILMSVTLIASVFGMNFSYMPELRWSYGYVAALTAMIGVGAALYAHFRARGWLDSALDPTPPRGRPGWAAILVGALVLAYVLGIVWIVRRGG
jgi:magnesium transporter